MSIISRIVISLTSRQVGSDAHGNRYFEAKRPDRLGRHKRFVLYAGTPEASKVPADWHGWLHHTEELPPPEGGYARRAWQKDHLPNLTGTIYAHKPAGDLTKGGKRKPATGDYEAWQPE
jgi:NADH:ubiquinone oxidoreductase subunit